MSFLKLIFKNPFRNKSRAFLAIVGIGIGIATIIALGGIMGGLVAGVDNALHAGGSDFAVLNKESSVDTNTGTATLDEKWLNKIQNISGVKNVEGVYLKSMPIENSYTTLIGVDISNNFNISSLSMTLIKGKIIKNESNELLFGKLALEEFNKSVGDQVTINNQKFTIVGVYESGDPNMDYGILASIKDVQNLSDDFGKVSVIYVYLDNEADVNKIIEKINSSYGDNITTATSIADLEMIEEQKNMINGASWGISLLAIVIGGIGIINTMIMSVYERTREIGVLKAVGWKNRRILGMIIGESLVLTITSGIIGTLIGIGGAEILASFNIIQSGLIPVFSIDLFIQAFAVAIIVGLAGGFYPAWRASRLPPTEALRYE